jgi:hypothetical protein
MPSGSDQASLVPVLRTSDKSLLLVVKTVLEAAGIPYAVQGEAAMRLFPLGAFGAGMFQPVLGAAILVAQERAQEARDLLEGLEGEGSGGAEPAGPADDET